MTELLSNMPYDDLQVGERHGPFAFPVTDSLASQLSASIGERQEVSWAPPAVYPALFLFALRQAMGGIPAGAILAKQELEFQGALRVGSDAKVVTWVGEKYIRRDRPYVVIEFDVRDEEDKPLVTGRKTIVWPTGPGER